MRPVKKMFVWLLTLSLVFAACILSAAAKSLPYESYTYDKDGAALPSPAAYVPERAVDHKAMGLSTPLNNPQDFCWSPKKESLYILDTGNNRLIQLDAQFRLIREVSKIHMTQEDYAKLKLEERLDSAAEVETKKKELLGLNAPGGLNIDRLGNVYVADTENNRLVKFDADLRQLAIFPLNLDDSPLLASLTIGSSAPDKEGSPADTEDNASETKFVYLPAKVAVDKADRIYVVARGVNQGLMEFTAQGTFTGFMGAPKVTFTPLQILQRKFMTKEQLSRIPTIVPTEFSNVVSDSEGFLYAAIRTVSAEQKIIVKDKSRWGEQSPVRRFNAIGIDILNRDGLVPPVGDLIYDNPDGVSGPSQIIDVTVEENGIYSMLDLPLELYTPIFAISRIAGWTCCAAACSATMPTAIFSMYSAASAGSSGSFRIRSRWSISAARCWCLTRATAKTPDRSQCFPAQITRIPFAAPYPFITTANMRRRSGSGKTFCA